MGSKAEDYNWQRQFIPEIKAVLANYLIDEASEDEDMRHNTDLMALEARTVRIACRMRHWEYWHRYGNEFTIRSGRPSGTPTELAKVVSGWGDRIFYGFEGPTPGTLGPWLLGDLREFRLWFNRQLAIGSQKWTIKPNGDGTTFHAFRVDDLPNKFVVSRRVTPPSAVMDGAA